MPERLMSEIAMLGEMGPADGSAHRYRIFALVINLTGKGRSCRDDQFKQFRTLIQPEEVNLEELDAHAVLSGIEAAEIPPTALALIPLMHNGQTQEIIDRWFTVAEKVKAMHLRDLGGYAVVFAELTNSRQLWLQAMKEIDVEHSQILKDSEARGESRGILKGEASGILKGEAKGKRESLLSVLKTRYRSIPAELEKAIIACQDLALLDRWLLDALSCATLAKFRKQTGL
jgi:hypothetical protein